MNANAKLDFWCDDLLGRRTDAELLEMFLAGRVEELKRIGKTGSYVLNLDASWGQGKSFFLKRFKQQLESHQRRVVLINAWESDFAEDPLIAVISGVGKAFPKDKGARAAEGLLKIGGRLAAITGKHAGRTLLKKVLGEDGAEIASVVGAELALGGFEGAKEAIDTVTDEMGRRMLKAFDEGEQTVSIFKDELRKLVEAGDYDSPLFVLIDELDRCRPTYAVALLERIKHLFDVDGVVFVVATDTEQLRHSIGVIYGQEFDGRGYLLRFFDRVYKFADTDKDRYICYLFALYGLDRDKLRSPTNNDHEKLFVSMTRMFDLKLREIERCFDLLRSVVTVWDKSWPIELVYMLPIIIGFCRQDTDLLRELEVFPKVRSMLNQAQVVQVDVEFDYTDGNHGSPTPRRKPVSLLSLIEGVGVLKNTPLPDIGRDGRGSGADAWIKDGFQEEFRRGYGNSFNERDKPLSECRNYFERVRAVGRFSSDRDD